MHRLRENEGKKRASINLGSEPIVSAAEGKNESCAGLVVVIRGGGDILGYTFFAVALLGDVVVAMMKY